MIDLDQQDNYETEKTMGYTHVTGNITTFFEILSNK